MLRVTTAIKLTCPLISGHSILGSVLCNEIPFAVSETNIVIRKCDTSPIAIRASSNKVYICRNASRVIFMENHYSSVIMSALAFQITGVSIVCSTLCSWADQRKHQSPAWLAFVGGIHRRPVVLPHKEPVPRKMFPFDDVIMYQVVWRVSRSASILSIDGI